MKKNTDEKWQLGNTLGEHFFEKYKHKLPSDHKEWELLEMYFNGLHDENHINQKNEFVLHIPLANDKHGFCIVFRKK